MSTKPSSDLLDTSQARAKILARIRSAQGRPDQAKDREEELSLNYIAQKPSGPQPPVGKDLVAQFHGAERAAADIRGAGAGP